MKPPKRAAKKAISSSAVLPKLVSSTGSQSTD
jgi:hypothetical protein